LKYVPLKQKALLTLLTHYYSSKYNVLVQVPRNTATMTTITRKSSASKRNKFPSLTFQDSMIDVASWWCYAILKNHDLKLFDELEGVLGCLSPIPQNSPLSLRLRCLVPWQELLEQLYTEGITIGKKIFERIQDALVLLHQRSFPQTTATTENEYKEVLIMVQTHSILSNLYKYLTGKNSSSDDETFCIVLDKCEAQLKSIYVDVDHIPQLLKDLVDKTNDLDCRSRKDLVINIVSASDSILRYKVLQNSVQKLLLRWFEHDIESDIPDLLKKRYRGIGFSDASSNESSPKNSTGEINPTNEDNNNDKITATTESIVEQRKSLKRKLKKNVNSNETSWVDSDSSDVYKSEEENEFLKIKCKRKKKLKSSEKLGSRQRRQMEELSLSMPAGESSFSSNKRLKSFANKGRIRSVVDNNVDRSFSMSKQSQWDSDSSDVKDSNQWSKREDEGMIMMMVMKYYYSFL